MCRNKKSTRNKKNSRASSNRQLQNSQCEGSHVSLNILTDNYPSETTWKIDDSDGNQLYAGGNYTSKYTSYEFQECFMLGSYIFKIFDSYGDGMLGNAGYTLSINNEIVKSGGGSAGFQTSEEYPFVITAEPSHAPSNSKIPSVFPSESYKPSSSLSPSNLPSYIPSNEPSHFPSDTPSQSPSHVPSDTPSHSKMPSDTPSERPTLSQIPSISNIPSQTMLPSQLPTISQIPTASPTREKIKELICLEKNYKYSFLISDSYGDGICCIEGKGSYSIKLDDVIIAEGGDFGKSENFWFKYHQCNQDIDCDNDDYSTSHTCIIEASACVYFPKACQDYGELIDIEIATFNFPESAAWVIEDGEGVIHYEGGPYQMSKRTFSHSKCLPDGVYKFKNTGSDILGIKLVAGDNSLLINEEFMQSNREIIFILGTVPVAPSVLPSISTSPTSSATDDSSCHACSLNEAVLSIEIMTDSKSKLENVILIDTYYNNKWEEKHRLLNFKSNAMSKFDMCFDKELCHRLVIKDSGSDGICCDYGNGWYRAQWKSECQYCNFI